MCIRDRARLPWFYILVYTLLSMAASQLYLLFPSYTRQIMNGSLNPALIYTVIAVVSGQACITSVSQFILAAASAKAVSYTHL